MTTETEFSLPTVAGHSLLADILNTSDVSKCFVNNLFSVDNSYDDDDDDIDKIVTYKTNDSNFIHHDSSLINSPKLILYILTATAGCLIFDKGCSRS